MKDAIIQISHWISSQATDFSGYGLYVEKRKEYMDFETMISSYDLQKGVRCVHCLITVCGV